MRWLVGRLPFGSEEGVEHGEEDVKNENDMADFFNVFSKQYSFLAI